ncbi:SDR family NAD(P)-dependent oxidoreductase [Cohnella sp. JJ-181]|uniref:SDR family NAD(P)-dependent oxidoreductase n=1 Tax=Cohnella rhizoplanae TaxID=2974897 RepID=UPI0022FFC0DD|nr:SDR family NAD(P)-dependent oxidoreductase [Cohnella sp. JJ-181]CAI6024191.1 A-factor type gamma-butyrolactone 1'-reductase (1S-forming) [Cohnella sp. JJ-181]
MSMNIDASKKDKVALVTGATSGIGRSTALLLASEGATVVVAARREEKGRQVVEEIRALGGEAAFLKMDVANEESVRDGIRWIVGRYGKLDLAVNNAGISKRPAPLIETDTKDLQDALQTNVVGLFASMKHEAAAMLKTGGGAIVNVSSINGLRPTDRSSAYSASKFAVEALTKVAAKEMAGHNIRINAIAPGPTKSEITEGLGEELLAGFAQLIPAKRMAESEEIAKAIAYLLSDDAAFAVGSTWVMDGGLIL